MNRLFIILILVISFLLVVDRLFLTRRANYSKKNKLDFNIGREVEISTDVIFGMKTGLEESKEDYIIQREQKDTDLVRKSIDSNNGAKVRFLKMDLKPENIQPPDEIINLKPNPE